MSTVIKCLLIGGVIAGGGAIGRMGLSAVLNRQKILRCVCRDAAGLESLLTMQNMTYPSALRRAAQGSLLSCEYRSLAELLENGSEEEDLGGKLKTSENLAELTPREMDLLVDFFVKLTECISCEEIHRAVDCFGRDAETLMAETEEGELKRAKVLQRVWLLAGIAAAVILI